MTLMKANEAETEGLPRFLVLLVLRHEIDDVALCFGELHFIHTLLGIPVHY